MLNLLIANKSHQNLQDLQNYISQYFPDIRVAYIAKNGKEVLNALNNFHYDILLLDSNLKYYDGFDILQKFTNIQNVNYQKSIIFLSDNKMIINNLKKHPLIFNAHLNTDSLSIILSSLKKLVDEKLNHSQESDMKTKIIHELQNIGYNLAHHGTHYIIETVILIAKFKYDPENLSKNVYPKVSKIYNKDLNNIKSNIITATNAACNNLDKQTIEKYLKVSGDTKPTAKMVIYYLLQKLEHRRHLNVPPYHRGHSLLVHFCTNGDTLEPV